MTGLIKRNPFDAVARGFDRDEFLTPFDRIFDSFMKDLHPTFSKEFGVDFFEKASYPKCDVIDYNDRLEMVFEIPGLSKDDVSIDIDGDVLTISGQKATDSSDTNKDDKDDTEGMVYIRRELKRSSFKRSFQTSSDKFDLEAVKAKFDNGILKLTLPKREHEVSTKRTVEIE